MKQKVKRQAELWGKIHGWLGEDLKGNGEPESGKADCHKEPLAFMHTPWTLGKARNCSPEQSIHEVASVPSDCNNPLPCQKGQALGGTCSHMHMSADAQGRPNKGRNLEPPVTPGIVSTSMPGDCRVSKLSDTLAAELEAALQDAAPKLNIERHVLGIADGHFVGLLAKQSSSDGTTVRKHSGGKSNSHLRNDADETVVKSRGIGDEDCQGPIGSAGVARQREGHAHTAESCMRLDLEHQAGSMENEQLPPQSSMGCITGSHSSPLSRTSESRNSTAEPPCGASKHTARERKSLSGSTKPPLMPGSAKQRLAVLRAHCRTRHKQGLQLTYAPQHQPQQNEGQVVTPSTRAVHRHKKHQSIKGSTGEFSSTLSH